MKYSFRAAVLSALYAVSISAAPLNQTTAGKKLIEYGWDCPNTAFVRQNIRQMEKRPFDGVIIRVTRTGPNGAEDTLGWRVFSRTRFVPADYEPAIADLAAVRFEKFTDNFIQVISMPGIDWFDPEWSAVAHNAGVMARVAKQGGCAGLMFDAEQYGEIKIWSYSALPETRRKEIPLETFKDKVRERGREFMRAVNVEFPKVKVLCFFGPSLSVDNPAYELLAPFLDGMCSAADEGTEIIDGYEQSYSYKSEAAFRKGRWKMTEPARELFRDKSAFNRVMRVGFGLWLDCYSQSRGGWFPAEPEKNLFSPDDWQTAVHHALSYSDRYVWIYSERLDWWLSPTVGPAYEQAQIDARKVPAAAVFEPDAGWAAGPNVPRAAKQANYSDAAVFGDLLTTHDVLLDLPATGWLFRVDPSDKGIREQWYRDDLDEKPWKPIEIRKFWEEQGWNYDGVGWYRLRFTAPDIPRGRKVALVVGAADESATVWLNGQKAGVHDREEGGWDKRFSLDITKDLKPGRENQIAVRVLDCTGAGGLWKSIKIMAPK